MILLACAVPVPALHGNGEVVETVNQAEVRAGLPINRASGRPDRS